MRTWSLLACLALLLGCSSSPVATDASTNDAGPQDDAGYDSGWPDTGAHDAALPPAPVYDATHTFPSFDLMPGAERLSDCQSWTLNNADPIYVSSVTMDAGPGWHHSNWMWVPDTMFAGDDGTFPCDARMFNELTAALMGGGVFFAQSTQATHEVQSFEPGAAFEIPPHARIIGTTHIFNLTAAPITTAMTFTIHGVASTDVTTLLHGMALDNRGISIGPHTTTQTDMTCNLAAVSHGGIDMRIHYVLPHYHGLATGFQLFAVGGAHDGELVYGTASGIGDPLGGRLDPPFDLTAATGLRLVCTYQNPGTDTVTFGPYRTDEMCMMLAFVDGRYTWGAQATTIGSTTTQPDGTVVETSGACAAIAH